MSSRYRRKHFLLCQQKKKPQTQGNGMGPLCFATASINSEGKFPSPNTLEEGKSSIFLLLLPSFSQSLTETSVLKAASVSVSVHYFVPP